MDYPAGKFPLVSKYELRQLVGISPLEKGVFPAPSKGQMSARYSQEGCPLFWGRVLLISRQGYPPNGGLLKSEEVNLLPNFGEPTCSTSSWRASGLLHNSVEPSEIRTLLRF